MNIETNIFFGSELMVAPITSKSIKELELGKVKVWFPKGKWYDFFTGQKYDGGVEISIFREKKLKCQSLQRLEQLFL